MQINHHARSYIYGWNPKLDANVEKYSLFWLDPSLFDLCQLELSWLDLSWLDLSRIELYRFDLSVWTFDFSKIHIMLLQNVNLFGPKATLLLPVIHFPYTLPHRYSTESTQSKKFPMHKEQSLQLVDGISWVIDLATVCRARISTPGQAENYTKSLFLQFKIVYFLVKTVNKLWSVNDGCRDQTGKIL